jgi:hypothetical protein
LSDTVQDLGGAPAKKRRAPRRKRASDPAVSEAALNELHATVCGVGLMVASLIPDDKRPQPDEIEAMLVPLERIYLRHMPDTGVNPDVADCLIFAVAFAGYMNRIGGFRRFGKRLTNMARSSRPSTTGTPPRRTAPAPYQAADGGGGYRTPEERLAQVVRDGQTSEEAQAAYEASLKHAQTFPEPVELT